MKIIFLIFIELFFELTANAILPVAPCNRTSFKEIRQLTNYFGSRDPRRTVNQYAAEKGLSVAQVEKQFSATGKITCPGAESGTAQLVGRNNLITTAGHIFYDRNCHPANLNLCYFQTVFGKKVKVKIKPSTAKIASCLGLSPNSKDDWAILELEKPIKSATPYLVPTAPVSFTPGDRITEVSGQSDNFPHKAPNIGECSVRAVGLSSYPNIPYVTDCSNGNGSSGSAQLVQREAGWELQAVDVLHNQRARDGSDYDLSQSFFTASAPVAGEFYTTLKRMAEQSYGSD